MRDKKIMVSQLDRVPGWVFGPARHPVLQFIRDFVLHRVGYRRSLRSAAAYAYWVALDRLEHRGKITPEQLKLRFHKIEKWL